MTRRATTAAALLGLLCSALVTGYALAPPALAQTQQGIDVSAWQGSINWQQVASSGVTFAYIRAGEGQSYVDPYFRGNWTSASAAGVTPGAYLYFHAGQDPVAQANLLVQQVRAVGLRGGNLVPAIDVETMDGQTAATLVANLQTTVNTVHSAIGALPAIYTSPVWWDDNVNSSAFTADPLWVACWCGSSPLMPASNWGGNGFRVWQYSDAGSVPGVSGNVDLDQTGAAPLPFYDVPTAQVGALPSSESSTTFQVTWQVDDGVPASSYVVWVEDGTGPWLTWAQTAQTSFPFTGAAGHTYSFFAQAFDANGRTAGGPWEVQASTSIAGGAPRTTPFGGLYAVDGTGSLHFGSSPPLAPSGGWPGANIVRGIAVAPGGQGGYVLDAYGGVWPFGNAPGVSMTGYWPGWDITRGIALRPDGHSGYVLDAYGGIWPFGGAPGVAFTGYWRGKDVARGITLRPDGKSGYVVDAYGGVWPFGGAPGVTMSGYWRGWDIARGIVSRPDGLGGYVLDGYGGVWPFGGASGVSFTGYWRGKDIARGVTLIPGSSTQGYVVDTDGGMWPFGGAPGVAMANYGTSATLHGISSG